MSKEQPLSFETERDKFEARKANGENVAYTAALNLPRKVKPLCVRIQNEVSSLEAISPLNPLLTFKAITKVRRQFSDIAVSYNEAYADCLHRLAEPVEGAHGVDNAWVQGFTSANGNSAIFELTSSYSALSETLDRKSAYGLACFSLYVAMVSLVTTIVFGWLSIQ